MQDFLTSPRDILCYDSKDMDRRRLLLYLLLNVLISVCVTSAILFWYDRNYRSVSVSAVQPAAQSLSQGVSAPQATLNPQIDIPVEIVSVIGAGTLNAEWVVVSYKGEDQINLANWQLRDENRHVFVFPQLVLHPNGAVQIHTASGTNTVIDLYWAKVNRFGNRVKVHSCLIRMEISAQSIRYRSYLGG